MAYPSVSPLERNEGKCDQVALYFDLLGGRFENGAFIRVIQDRPSIQ